MYPDTKIEHFKLEVIRKDLIKDLSDNFYYPLPLLPLLKTVKISGKYTVNLNLFTCTCKSFNMKIKEYRKRDIRRACIHLFSAIEKYSRNYLNELTFLLIESQFSLGQKYLFKLSTRLVDFYYGFNSSFDIMIIYYFTDHWERTTFVVSDPGINKRNFVHTEINESLVLFNNFILKSIL